MVVEQDTLVFIEGIPCLLSTVSEFLIDMSSGIQAEMTTKISMNLASVKNSYKAFSNLNIIDVVTIILIGSLKNIGLAGIQDQADRCKFLDKNLGHSFKLL